MSDRIWMIVVADQEPRWGSILFAGSEDGMKQWFRNVHEANPELLTVKWLKASYGIVSRRANQEGYEAGWFYPDVTAYEKEFNTRVFR
jgi:hypothetical protein